MIKQKNKSNECNPSKQGHIRFIKRLIYTQIYGGVCDACYLCGEKCHYSSNEITVDDSDHIEYKPGYKIDKFMEIDPTNSTECFKKIDGKEYIVSGFKYVVPKHVHMKYDIHNINNKTNKIGLLDEKTYLLDEKQPIRFSELTRILYPVYKRYIAVCIDNNKCHCFKHQIVKIRNAVNNVTSLSNKTNICKQCGHEHHINACINSYSIIFPGASGCFCSRCMCYDCLSNELPTTTKCCGLIDVSHTIDDLHNYINNNAIPHKFLK